ncbi:MAG: hypothetical protein WAU47_14580 [Desulfobaccales bacterium]
MLHTTLKGEAFDLEKDFSSPERHILQKLFIWQEMAASVEEFRRKKAEALLAGWNNSGPIREGRALERLTQDMEERVALRLKGLHDQA